MSGHSRVKNCAIFQTLFRSSHFSTQSNKKHFGPRCIIEAMPTLKEVNNTPLKAEKEVFKTPRGDVSRKSAPSLVSEISGIGNDKKNKPTTAKKKKSSGDSKGGCLGDSKKKSSGKRGGGGRQISIFESIGVAAPVGKTTPKSSSGGGGATPKSSKKRKTLATVPNLNAKPICIHLTIEGKDPKKVKIDCHAVKTEFDDIFDSPIVLKENTIEKRAFPKDPLRRFLRGFGRYIH